MGCCIFCKGSGFASTIMNLTITFTFYLHLIGLISPHWMCEGGSCSVHGLNFYCEDADVDETILPLVVIVLISAFVLTVVFCLVMNFTPYRFKSMSKCLAIFFAAWYIIQEILSIVALIVVHVEYDSVGWGAYIFLIPGIIGMIIMILIIVFFCCFRERFCVDSDGED